MATKKSATSGPVTAGQLLERLRRHYIAPGAFPGGVFVCEIGLNGSGVGSGGKVRRCDALHVGFTSTSGRILTGHELKVSRADWLHELGQPHKAEQWASQCHAWYVVAPNCEMVRPEELPHGWGLMVINPRTTTRLDTVVKATVDDTLVPSWWAVRSLLARLDTLTESAIAARVQSSVAVQVADVRRGAERTQSRDEKLALDLIQVIRRTDRYFFSRDSLDLEDLASVLTDRASARDAIHQARSELRGIVHSVRSVMTPFSTTFGALATELERIATVGEVNE